MSNESPPPLTELLEGRRIDWERILIEIQQSSWGQQYGTRATLRRIANACDRAEHWAWKLKNIPGTEPKFHDGLMLIGLWAEKTGKGHSGLPLHPDFKSPPS